MVMGFMCGLMIRRAMSMTEAELQDLERWASILIDGGDQNARRLKQVLAIIADVRLLQGNLNDGDDD
jgi:hypothetical protein